MYSQKSASEIFTEEVYENLIEIDYWVGDTKVVINNEEDMKIIYKTISSLKLRHATFLDGRKYGYIDMDLVTTDKKISMSFSNGDIFIDGKRYTFDKKITETISNIALKNQ